MSKNFFSQLTSTFPNLTFKRNYPLKMHTTVKIGGPAEVALIIKSEAELKSIVTFCIQQEIEFHILGWGANTLISDRGLSGLTIINQSIGIEVITDHTPPLTQNPLQLNQIRWDKNAREVVNNLFNYHHELTPRVFVKISSGTPIPLAINKLFELDITGLEWFTRIPATIAGGIFNNIHGANHFIGEYIHSVEIINPEGQAQIIHNHELEFAYDYSRFHHSREIIISALFVLFKGHVAEAKQASRQWAIHKSNHPAKSLGCIFQNISELDQARLKLPSNSIGYLIDHELKLKGLRVGDAQVSNQHAAFIENIGNARSDDYLTIIRIIQKSAMEKWGLYLQPEIFFKGFTKAQLASILDNQKGK